MPQPTALCVYCGSQSGNNPVYIETAHAFGLELARRDITLVYGGGKVGLMGTVANAALSGGGKVIGVIPPRRPSLPGPGPIQVKIPQHLWYNLFNT